MSAAMHSGQELAEMIKRDGGFDKSFSSNTSQRKPVPENIIAILKRPLPSEAVNPHPTKKYLSTIKVMYVVERLNEAFGLGGWFVGNEIIEAGPAMVVVRSRLTVPEYGIDVEQFGGNDNTDRGDAYKGACTDALSKIGSYLYIGMDVYKGLGDKIEKQTPPKQQPKPAIPKPSGTGLAVTPEQQRAYAGPTLPIVDKGTAELSVAITGVVGGFAKNKNEYRLVNFHVPYDNFDHKATCWKKDLFPVLEAAGNAPDALLRFSRSGKYLEIEDVLEDFIPLPPQPAVAATEIVDSDIPF